MGRLNSQQTSSLVVKGLLKYSCYRVKVSVFTKSAPFSCQLQISRSPVSVFTHPELNLSQSNSCILKSYSLSYFVVRFDFNTSKFYSGRN